jgi:hypothetical protein
LRDHFCLPAVGCRHESLVRQLPPALHALCQRPNAGIAEVFSRRRRGICGDSCSPPRRVQPISGDARAESRRDGASDPVWKFRPTRRRRSRAAGAGGIGAISRTGCEIGRRRARAS